MTDNVVGFERRHAAFEEKPSVSRSDHVGGACKDKRVADHGQQSYMRVHPFATSDSYEIR